MKYIRSPEVYFPMVFKLTKQLNRKEFFYKEYHEQKKTTKIDIITKTTFYNNKVTELILKYTEENNFNPFSSSNVQNLNLEFNLNDITIQT